MSETELMIAVELKSGMLYFALSVFVVNCLGGLLFLEKTSKLGILSWVATVAILFVTVIMASHSSGSIAFSCFLGFCVSIGMIFAIPVYVIREKDIENLKKFFESSP